eukprot:3941650-Rhodomonas_salina.3
MGQAMVLGFGLRVWSMLLRLFFAESDTEMAYAATRSTDFDNCTCNAGFEVRCAISLLARYAMSGTAHASSGENLCAICLRECYAMPGTDIAYAAICLRARYAMSGTEIADGVASLAGTYKSFIGYAPTRLVRNVRY